NLAFALADAGQRVCLIEADLRRPTLAESLGLVTEVGLTSVLIGRADIGDVVQRVTDNLGVIASGQIPPNPSELLESEAFLRLLAAVGELTDVVVIDTAPLLVVADGAQVAAHADATLLTVRANRTTHEQIGRAIGALKNVAVTPVGVVLSMTPKTRGGSYTYYEGYRPDSAGGRSSRRTPGRDGSDEPLLGSGPDDSSGPVAQVHDGGRTSVTTG
ncbi:MAG: CpsD/CapB family tyrosine-protein kinase, partial [Frankiaceae bacterium]|nr:CpsD/CapB family tyrosine-protein kinase [Frankiaceae bacterium]